MKLIDSKLYLSVSELVAYGISENYLKKSLHKQRANSSCNWRHIPDPSDGRRVLIDYDGISSRSRAKLPSKDELLARYIERLEKEKAEALAKASTMRKSESEAEAPKAAAATLSEVRKKLKDAVEGDYLRFLPHYLGLKIAEQKAQELAKAAAALNVAVELGIGDRECRGKNIKPVRETTGASLAENFLAEVAKLELKYLNLENRDYFYRKLRIARREGLFSAVKLPRSGNTNGGKMTAWHEWQIERLFALPKKYTCVQVHDLLTWAISSVNENRPTDAKLDIVSLSSVEKYCARTDVQNRTYLWRHGKKAWSDAQCPYIPRHSALFPADLWVMDGTQAQFWYKGESGKPEFLNWFVVWDSASRAVLGYSLHETEDRYSVVQALKMAVSLHGWLPFEILSDNSSAIKQKETTELLTKIAKTVRHSKVGNAQDKPVERFFSTFQTAVGKRYDNYAGEGIRSKRKGAHPAPEHVQRLFKQGKLPDRAGLIAQMAEMVAVYNALSINERPSPNDVLARYKDELPPNARKIETSQLVQWFWNAREVTVQRGMVKLTVRNVEYLYGIFDHALKIKLNTEKVRVRFDETDLSRVHLFDAESDEYITECRQTVRTHIAEANRSENDVEAAIKQHSHIEGFGRYVERTAADLRTEAEAVADVRFPFAAIDPRERFKDEINAAEAQQLRRYVYDQTGLPELQTEAQRPKPVEYAGTTPYENDFQPVQTPRRRASLYD